MHLTSHATCPGWKVSGWPFPARSEVSDSSSHELSAFLQGRVLPRRHSAWAGSGSGGCLLSQTFGLIEQLTDWRENRLWSLDVLGSNPSSGCVTPCKSPDSAGPQFTPLLEWGDADYYRMLT